MKAVELRVIVTTNDERENAADRLEHEVRRALTLSFGDQVYVEMRSAEGIVRR